MTTPTTKPQVGQGNIKITLDGEEYELRPTLNAALTISRLSGGIRGAIDAVLKMDIDVVVKIVQLGLATQVAKQFKDLPQTVWESGMTDTQGQLASKCVEYL